MKIVNSFNTDYHIHSLNFSDGFSTIDEIVRYAWECWLEEIAITDHSQEVIDFAHETKKFYNTSIRVLVNRWKNPYNNVNVIFGVEWDLLNEDGDCCFHISWFEPEFLILSAHNRIYKSDPTTVTKWTIKAIEKNHEKIKFIGHPCNNNDFGKYYDIKKLVEVANEYKIPLEFNAKNLYYNKTNLEKLDYLLKNANEVYLNTDTHMLWEMKETKINAIKFLNDNHYI